MQTNRTKDNFIIPLCITAGMIIVAYFSGPTRFNLGPGVKVHNAPLQEDTGPQSSFIEGNYTVTPLANFSCSAKLIGSKTYSDNWSDICPIDYTLGWQELSDESVIQQIAFSQRGRWTHYSYGSEFKDLTGKELIELMTNAHMCPADDEIRSKLMNAPVGSIIKFSGKLISLKHNQSGWHAISSTSRKDTGDGGCEIIWVEHFSIVDK